MMLLKKQVSMNQGTDRKTLRMMAVSLSLLLISNFALPTVASAASNSKPSGTLLLPLTPRIDQNELPAQSKPARTAQPKAAAPAQTKAATTTAPQTDVVESSDSGMNASTESGAPAANSSNEDKGRSGLQSEVPQIDKDAPSRISAEDAHNAPTLEATATADDLVLSEMDAAISEDTTLRGTIQIVADDTEYDQEKNTFLGTGNAVAIIGGQNSKLEADMILYDQNTNIVDARGHVKILRNGQLTLGSAFKFKVDSDEYLITKPDTELNGTQVIARGAYGVKGGMIFRNGTLETPKPFHIGKNMMFGPLSATTDIADKLNHPDAYLPEKGSFVFKARKMTYEKYKENGNLTVLGGRMVFNKFTIPIPKFIATTGQENNIMFPVTPMISSNMQSGGVNIGPSFNSSMGKTGKFHWAPMVQLGGRTPGNDTGSGLGLSGQVGFSNKKLSSNIAYGSVSNMLVADFKTKLSPNTKFHAGINRFLEDGMYGYRRARLMAEAVHNYAVPFEVPYLSSVNFRSAAGWAQDNPQLINTSPAFAALFGGTTTNTVKTSAFRITEQMSIVSQPVFSVGNEKYGAKGYFFGGLAASGYSSGDSRLMGQIGPSILIKANRFNLNTNYTQSAVRGSSPFLFDQFLQGSKSANIQGDVKINKWLTLGGGYGYSFDSKLPFQKSVSAAIGPPDFKVLLTRNMIQGINRFGFDLMYGQPIPFQRLVLKGSPDHGQLGGI